MRVCVPTLSATTRCSGSNAFVPSGGCESSKTARTGPLTILTILTILIMNDDEDDRVRDPLSSVLDA